MIPEGLLVRSRVVSGAGPVLEDALDRRLTGFAVLAPRDALLGEGEDRGILTFRDGVPVLADHTDDRPGPEALAALATPGPYRLELYELPSAALGDATGDDHRRVPPGMPAERLAGDPDLADRTRRAAPAEWLREDDDSPDEPASAVEAFLADEERVEAIREQARAEARQRAAEWGFEDAI